MADKIRILLLEDHPSDGQLIEAELRRASLDFTIDRVQTEHDLLARLEDSHDVILADYGNPQFNALRTVRILRDRGLDVPFIIVSGTKGEDIAVAAMKHGAHDYLMKDRIGRLGGSVKLQLELKKSRDANRRSEAALCESERRTTEAQSRLAAIVESSDDAIIGKTLEGIVTSWNNGAQRLFGYVADEIIGQPVSLLVQPDRLEEQESLLVHLKRGEHVDHLETLRRRKDGTLLNVSLSVSQVRDAAGKLIGASTIIRDITERKKSQIEISKREVKYRRLFETAKDGILILDAGTGKITDCNPFLTRLLGYSLEEILGKELWEIGVFEDIVAFKAAFAELQEKAYIRFEHMPLQTRDGRRIDVEFVSNSYHVDDKLVMQCNIRDISERRTLETQLRQAQKMEAIGQLAGGVAHDFNNLLTVINGRSQLLISRFKPGDKIRNDLELIFKTGERAASLTRQLLAFSRKQILEPVILDLNAVSRDMDKMLHRLIHENIKLVTVFDPLLKRVKADPGQIDQVIMNLVINACDAMPNGGKLTIETANVELNEEYCLTHTEVKSGHYVMLAVSDTGHGMDAATKARLFEPFFTTKPQGKGTGLGLATVFGIVKQSKGHIEAFSEVGKGSTFRVYLPPTKEKVISTASLNKVAVAVGHEVILVVEDEDGVRALVRDLLEMNGYTVLVANNGIDALRVCQTHDSTINLLMTDVVMPEMGGPELAERIRVIHPETKALFTSGYTDHAIVRHGELEASVAFIQKPFTPAGLSRKVREILDKTPERQEDRR